MSEKSRYLHQKKLSPADELRTLLNELEGRPNQIERMTPTQAFVVLRDLDRAKELFTRLEAAGLDLQPERVRFGMMSAALKQRARDLLTALGDADIIAERRPTDPTPDRESRWWWYLPEVVAAQQSKRLRQVGIVVGVIVLLVGGIALLLNTVFAPTPQALARNEVEIALDRALADGEYEIGLAAVDTAFETLPDSPTLYIMQGVLHDLSGDDIAAEASFEAARANTDDLVSFYMTRGRLYLQGNEFRQARLDAASAVALDEENARAWLLLGQTYEAIDEIEDAIEAYERAGQIASNTGDDQMVVTARVAIARLTSPGGLLAE